MIRAAKLSDALDVATVHVETWQRAYKDIVPEAYLKALSVDKKLAHWSRSIEVGTPELLVAEVDSNVIGWVAFGSSRDEDSNSRAGEIEAIYVLPKFWSKGVGKALWTKAMGRLMERGFDSVSLWVLVENQRAIEFYLKAGLVPDAEMIKEIEIEGKTLQEIRYRREVG